MQRFILISLLSLALLAPSAVSAQTTEDTTAQLQAQIAALIQTISDLQQQIASLRGEVQETKTEVKEMRVELNLYRSLYRGVSGDDVENLQEYLSQFEDVYPEGLITGFFGPLTEKAVKKWQKKHGVVSSGDANTTGYGVMGPKSRAKLHKLLADGAGKSGKIPPGLAKKFDKSYKNKNKDKDDDEGDDDGDDDSDDNDSNTGKVTVCHKPGTPAEKTKTLPLPALQGHLGHGDTLGACDDDVVTCTSFTYSTWTLCQTNNTQTRTVLTSSPDGCAGGNPEITMTCTYIPPGGGGGGDTTAPVISSVSAITTGSSATIQWFTNEDANSTVTYALAPLASASTTTDVVDGAMATSHAVLLSGLSPDTTYYYKVTSADASGNSATSAEYSFTTNAVATNPPTAPTALQTEGSTNPTGVTDLTPEFSAVYNDPDAGDAALYYQLQVTASSGEWTTLAWDSGKTSMTSTSEGSRSPLITYAGTVLSEDGTQYYWRIKFWDDEDNEGAWSNGSDTFTMNTAGPLSMVFVTSPGNKVISHPHGYSTGVSWTTVHGSEGLSTGVAPTQNYAYIRSSTNGSGTWDAIQRTLIPFDTSALPDGATILSAKVYVRGTVKYDDGNWNVDTALYSADPASPTSASPGDYDSFGTTLLSSIINYDDWSVTDFNQYELNANGLAHIDKTGWSIFGARNASFDVANTEPTWSSGKFSYVKGYVYEGDEQYRPYLEIFYQ